MSGYTVSSDGNYIIDNQGYVVSGAKPQDLSGITSNQNNTDYGSLWNTAWNAGYNNAGASSNPYSGQSGNGYDIGAGYTQGQQQYAKDQANKTTTTNTGGATTNTGGTTNTSNNSDLISKYQAAGWNDLNAINADIAAGGGSKYSGSTGGNGYSDALNASRSAFNNAYDPVFSQLDQMAGLIPTQQANKMNTLNNLYGSQQTELSGNMQGSLGALDTSRGQVAASKAQSIRDLQQQMNQMSKAGGMQLGSAGAGDSSAARMYNFALSKAAGQSSADVSNQANSQYAQIQGQEQQIRATYDDQLNKLATWKNEQTGAIQDWADNQLIQIRNAKLTATGQKAAALAATETGLIQNALSRIQQIDDQITSWNQGIQTWALNRMATIDDAKAKISGYGQYTSQDIVANKLQGLNNVQGADSGGMTGYYNSQKKDEQNFLNSFK